MRFSPSVCFQKKEKKFVSSASFNFSISFSELILYKLILFVLHDKVWVPTLLVLVILWLYHMLSGNLKVSGLKRLEIWFESLKRLYNFLGLVSNLLHLASQGLCSSRDLRRRCYHPDLSLRRCQSSKWSKPSYLNGVRYEAKAL